jgi:hypothetical protein
MTESPTSGRDTSGDPPPIQHVRTEEPQAPVGQDEPNPNVVSDATADEKGPGEPVDPGVGGYAGRDPKTEMPRMPSIPETQDDKRA